MLSKAEVQELTSRRRRSAQADALRHMGIEHRIRPDGSAAVLRAHVENLLGGVSINKASKAVGPDWSKIA